MGKLCHFDTLVINGLTPQAQKIRYGCRSERIRVDDGRNYTFDLNSVRDDVGSGAQRVLVINGSNGLHNYPACHLEIVPPTLHSPSLGLQINGKNRCDVLGLCNCQALKFPLESDGMCYKEKLHLKKYSALPEILCNLLRQFS